MRAPGSGSARALGHLRGQGFDRHECEFRSLLSASHSHSSLKLPGTATGYMTDPQQLAAICNLLAPQRVVVVGAMGQSRRAGPRSDPNRDTAEHRSQRASRPGTRNAGNPAHSTRDHRPRARRERKLARRDRAARLDRPSARRNLRHPAFVLTNGVKRSSCVDCGGSSRG